LGLVLHPRCSGQVERERHGVGIVSISNLRMICIRENVNSVQLKQVSNTHTGTLPSIFKEKNGLVLLIAKGIKSETFLHMIHIFFFFILVFGKFSRRAATSKDYIINYYNEL
jgi:hypothetical protein